MAADTTGVIVQVNFKDRNENLYNVYGRNADEFGEGLAILKAYAAQIAEVESLFKGVSDVTAQIPVTAGPPTEYVEPQPFPSSPAAPPAAGGWGAPAPAPQAPPVPQSCAHGPRKIVKGNGAKGPWMGAFCDTPKGTPGQCEPIWIKKGSPEWNANQ